MSRHQLLAPKNTQTILLGTGNLVFYQLCCVFGLTFSVSLSNRGFLMRFSLCSSHLLGVRLLPSHFAGLFLVLSCWATEFTQMPSIKPWQSSMLNNVPSHLCHLRGRERCLRSEKQGYTTFSSLTHLFNKNLLQMIYLKPHCESIIPEESLSAINIINVNFYQNKIAKTTTRKMCTDVYFKYILLNQLRTLLLIILSIWTNLTDS